MYALNIILKPLLLMPLIVILLANQIICDTSENMWETMSNVKDSVQSSRGQLVKVNDLGDPESKERGSNQVTC